jgi:tryptophan-rich sensory protein
MRKIPFVWPILAAIFKMAAILILEQVQIEFSTQEIMKIETKIIKIDQILTLLWVIYFCSADNGRHLENGRHIEFGPSKV